MRWFQYFIVFSTVAATSVQRLHAQSDSPLHIEVSLLGGGVTMLDRLAGPKGTVLIVRGGRCQLSSKASLRLRKLEEKLSKMGIEFIYLYVGQTDIAEKASQDLELNQWQGTYVVDIGLLVSKKLSLSADEEVMAFSNEGRLIYRGELDVDALAVLSKNLADSIPMASHKNSTKKCEVENSQEPSLIASKELQFNRDIFPILERKCLHCHRQERGLIDLSTYGHFVGRARMIEHVLKTGLMPPWSVKENSEPWVNDQALRSEEKSVLLSYLKTEMPEGVKPPSPRFKWSKSWTTGEPDYILKLPKVVNVPADGVMPYQHFIIENPFKKDIWVKGFEVLTKPQVVHHLLVHVLRDGKNVDPDQFPRNFVSRFGWALGNPPGIFPPGVGALIPARSKIALTVHYQPTGQKITDRETQIGFYIHSEKPKYLREEWVLLDEKLVIPPGHENFKVQQRYAVEKDSHLMALNVHMHLRGKKAEINLLSPGGKKETLLKVDPYRFDHQYVYELQNPRELKKGMSLECITHFDNSRNNPTNPNPLAEVRWGEKTEDEMSICSIYVFR